MFEPPLSFHIALLLDICLRTEVGVRVGCGGGARAR